MRRFNYCWLFLFLIFSTSSYSADYIWTATFDAYTRTGASPSSACSTAIAAYNAGGIGRAITLTTVTMYNSSNPNIFTCRWADKNGYSGPSYSFSAYRSGDSCPSGTQYTVAIGECTCPAGSSLQNGQCVADNPCLSKNGTSSPFSKSGTVGDGYGFATGGGTFSQAQDGCFSGCAASTVDQKCTFKVSGEYTCRGTASYSGSTCVTSPAPDVDPTTDTSTPEPQDYTDAKPCTYVTDSNGVQTCQSSTTQGTEGQSCGTVNGVVTCFPKTPTEQGVVIDTKVETKTNPDGSTTTTKTDTATSSNCSGVGPCTTSTTTITTSTTKGADGITESVTGSCVGDRCPDKNTNPDGDGDGLGDCTGESCGEGEGGASDWYTPGDDTYASVIGDFAEAVKTLPVTQGVTNFLTFTPSGACPVYEVNAWVFNVRLDQWCSNSTIPWGMIAAVILGCCAFLSFRIAFL